MISLCIPRYKLIESEPSKPYYVYVIHVSVSGKCHKIEKRYSAIHSIHKVLRKHIGSQSVPEFPPKRVYNMTSRVLEQRRQALEAYLQAMINLNPVPAAIFPFLGIKHQEDSSDSLDTLDEEISTCLSHQPVVSFAYDPFIEPEYSDLPNTVTDGVLQGLYGDLS